MDIIPSRLHRATVSLLRDQAVLLTGYSPAEQTGTEPYEKLSSLEEAIDQSPVSQKWSVDCHYVADGGELIAAALRDGTAIAVSDGSFKDQFGTAALVIEGPDSDNQMLAVNVTPGHPEEQLSYRSELSGIFGIVTFVNLT